MTFCAPFRAKNKYLLQNAVISLNREGCNLPKFAV